ncbi:MAG: hypothetical protein Q7R67_02220 [bacterium]|nr:hypothetical protein [bacterium]
MTTSFRDGMVITSHATGIIDPTVAIDGKVTFSVPQYYKRDGRTSRRQIVETSENGERVSDTMQRALDDEISDNPGSAKLELLEDKPFHIVFGNDERHKDGTHLKMFFFAHTTGERRKYLKFDGREELGPMVDVEVEELIVAMEKEGTVPLHLEVTKIALRALANKDKAVLDRYWHLLIRCPQVEEISEAEWETIYAYNKWF